MLFNEQGATIKSEMTVCVCDENILYDVELSKFQGFSILLLELSNHMAMYI